jgi:hypothetical protein
MVVGPNTFTGDLAAGLGLDKVFADSDERYPHVSVVAITEARRPDVVVLADEPYRFSQTDGPVGIPRTAVGARVGARNDLGRTFPHVGGRGHTARRSRHRRRLTRESAASGVDTTSKLV